MAKIAEVINPKLVLKHCRELGLETKTLASCLAVNPKTIERWQKESAEPNEAAGRMLEKLEALYEIAVRLFKKDSRRSWFYTPNETLGGESPMEVLGRGELDQVKNVLGMLEWGIYS